MDYKILRLILTSALLCFGFAACGGDGDDDDDTFGVARVVQLFLDDAVIAVGQGTVVHVEFTFDADEVFDNNDNVRVVAKLPAQVTYREGTGEVQGPSDDDVGAQIFTCGAGNESYVLFDLDSADLDTADNPSGDADAEVTFTIDGVSAVNGAVIEATASEIQPPFACGQAFAANQSVLITVAG